jgi:N-acylneuraminate cytidylyltransferase
VVTDPDHRIIALIPARGGSERVPRKNIRHLAGHPLIAYTIAAAKASGVFAGIFVSTEDEQIGRLALSYGGLCWIKRPEQFATSQSPDIDWVTHALEQDTACALPFDSFAILRPTSPFRSAATIRAAWLAWQSFGSHFDSLRAMEPVSQHPGKMWQLGAGHCATATPFATFGLTDPPAHSRATQSLPPVYVQNASLEIAWTDTVFGLRSISGDRVLPLITPNYDGFDLNTELDWVIAEALVARGLAVLPEVGP